MLFGFLRGARRWCSVALGFSLVGNLYGPTSEGGLGSGAIFKLTPIGGGRWTESVDHPFEGSADGGFSSPRRGSNFGNSFGAVESWKISICNRV